MGKSFKKHSDWDEAEEVRADKFRKRRDDKFKKQQDHDSALKPQVEEEE